MGPNRKVFTIYSSQNIDLLQHLLFYLKPLEEELNVTIWHDDPIRPKQVWKPQDSSQLQKTDIFLFLVSDAFMHSQFIQQDEFKTIIDSYKAGKATVIPILLDNCPWDIEFNSDDYDFSFKELQVLPEDRKPISDWSSADEALEHVSDKVKQVIAPSIETSAPKTPSATLEEKPVTELREEQVAISLKEETVAKAKEERELSEATEVDLSVEKEEKLKVENEIKSGALEEQRLKKEADAKSRIEAALKIKEEAAAKNTVEEENKVKEEAEIIRIASEKQRLKAEAEAKNKAEEGQRIKEEAAAKKRVEEEEKAKKVAEIKRFAIEEQRLKVEAEAKERAEQEQKLREEAHAKKWADDENIQNEEAIQHENDGETNYWDEETKEGKNNKLKNRALLVIFVALAAIGIWFYSELNTDPSKQAPKGSNVEATETNDADTSSKAKVDSDNQENSFTELGVGDSFKGGIIFSIDQSGTSGKIAYSKDAGPMTWTKANNIHEQLGEGWRLPTIDELKIMYRTLGKGATNSGDFTDELYWSTTAYDTYQARLLRFSDGNSSFHYNKGVHRQFLVRAIQDFGK